MDFFRNSKFPLEMLISFIFVCKTKFALFCLTLPAWILWSQLHFIFAVIELNLLVKSLCSFSSQIIALHHLFIRKKPFWEKPQLIFAQEKKKAMIGMDFLEAKKTAKMKTVFKLKWKRQSHREHESWPTDQAETERDQRLGRWCRRLKYACRIG